MAQPDYIKRAKAAYEKRQDEKGFKLVSVRLSEPARKALDGLAEVHGSRVKALEHLLLSGAPGKPFEPFSDEALASIQAQALKRISVKPRPVLDTVTEEVRERPSVQFGPTPRKYGELAKKPKR